MSCFVKRQWYHEVLFLVWLQMPHQKTKKGPFMFSSCLWIQIVSVYGTTEHKALISCKMPANHAKESLVQWIGGKTRQELLTWKEQVCDLMTLSIQMEYYNLETTASLFTLVQILAMRSFHHFILPAFLLLSSGWNRSSHHSVHQASFYHFPRLTSKSWYSC